MTRAFQLLQMSHQCYILASTTGLADVVAQRVSVELHRYHTERLKAVQQTTITMVTDFEDEKDTRETDIDYIGTSWTQIVGPKSRASRLKKTWSILGEAIILRTSTNSLSFEVSLQPPILRRIWSIQAIQTYGGWKYVFRHGGCMSKKLVDCINSDDDAGVVRLFESRESSPYDRDGNGRSLYDYAAYQRSFRVCMMLLKSRLVDESKIEGAYDISAEKCDIRELLGLSDFTGDQVRVMNSLGYELDWHLDLNNPHPVIHNVASAASVLDCYTFNTWQRLYFPQYHELPVSSRSLVGRMIATRPVAFEFLDEETWLPQPEIFKYFIDTTWDAVPAKKIIAQSVESGCSVLGSVAHAFSWVLATYSAGEKAPVDESDVSFIQEWEHLTRDIILEEPKLLNPIEIHRIWIPWVRNAEKCAHAEFTPLWAVFSGALLAGYRIRTESSNKWCGTRPKAKYEKLANNAVMRWLQLLHSCGINLEEYGRVEKGFVFNSKVTRDLEINLVDTFKDECHDGLIGWLRVIAIDIGPSPEDWRTWWVFEYEIYAQEFWEMVEETGSELVIPGGWID